MGYWQRKYHLQHVLLDGNIWHGFINIEADTKEELPENVYGTFWAERKNNLCYGRFKLDNNEPHDKRKNQGFAIDAYVIHTYISRPELKNTKLPTSTAEAYEILKYLEHVKEDFELFEDRLENCQYATETHYWE